MTAPGPRPERLSTQFPARLAVDAFALDVEPGGIFGPDGSGGSLALARRRLNTLETV